MFSVLLHSLALIVVTVDVPYCPLFYCPCFNLFFYHQGKNVSSNFDMHCSKQMTFQHSIMLTHLLLFFLITSHCMYVITPLLIFLPVLWLFLSLFNLTEKFVLQGSNLWSGSNTGDRVQVSRWAVPAVQSSGWHVVIINYHVWQNCAQVHWNSEYSIFIELIDFLHTLCVHLWVRVRI